MGCVWTHLRHEAKPAAAKKDKMGLIEPLCVTVQWISQMTWADCHDPHRSYHTESMLLMG